MWWVKGIIRSQQAQKWRVKGIVRLDNQFLDGNKYGKALPRYIDLINIYETEIDKKETKIVMSQILSGDDRACALR